MQHQQSYSLTLLNQKSENQDNKTVAVIVTISNGGSYDKLFTTVQQKALQGTKVQVYACDSLYLENLIEAFEGKPKDDVAIRLMKSISEVDKDCVVFNWECCGAYAMKQFPEGTDKLFYFLKKVIDRGHMAMFSDFSLKSLINNWHDKYELGPNPFIHTNQYTGNFTLHYNPGTLKECPSAQLQTVGDMTENGTCNMMAAGGTVVYCVNQKNIDHKIYKLQLLTVTPNIKPKEEYLICQIGDHSGSAGHVLLTYPSGGMILTSMGHWVELMKIDTSANKLFEVAEQQFGIEKAKKMRSEYEGMSMMEQQKYISSNARDFVQNQAPCSNMLRNARRRT